MSLTYLDTSSDGATVASVLRREGAVAVRELVAPDLGVEIVRGRILFRQAEGRRGRPAGSSRRYLGLD